MKFEIFLSDKSGKYYFRLKSRNGQIILQSQGYEAKSSAQNGIASVSKHCSDPSCYETKQASNGKWHFNLNSSNGQIIGSSQMYASSSTMKAGMEALQRVAPIARTVDLT
ncbi:MAG: YegP family protein [Saprospiraceae bacterium]|nr:YegP family protein [Saprospiraceae bacterium]